MSVSPESVSKQIALIFLLPFNDLQRVFIKKICKRGQEGPETLVSLSHFCKFFYKATSHNFVLSEITRTFEEPDIKEN